MTDPAPFAEMIGDPVDHLRSPIVIRFWLEQAGIDAAFTAVRVERAALGSFIARHRADPAWKGCTIAAPLKLEALMLADDITDRAAAAGAANLLAPRDGRLVAANTDVGAMLAVLAPLLERHSAQGITILGDGGAVRSALVALKLLGAMPLVRLQSRDHAAATKVSVEFGIEYQPVPFNTPIASSGLVNATPLGRPGFPAVDLDLARMPGQGWVVDLVADGADTTLLGRARSRGLLAVDGTAVLVEQCAASFELLFGASPPRAHDEQLFAMLRR
jgi:shikimate dehydrogenase